MKCGKCGYENSEGRFCKECGAPLNEYSGGESERYEPSAQYGESRGGIDIQAENAASDVHSDDERYGNENFRNAADNFHDTEDAVYGDKEKDAGSGGDDTDAYGGDDESATSAALENLKKFEEGSIPHPKDKPEEKRKFYCPKNPMLWSFLWLLLFGAILGGLSAFFFSVDLEGTQIIFGIVFAVFTAAVLAIDFIYYFPAALTLDKLLKGKGVRLEYRLKKHELLEQAEHAKKRNRGFYLAIGLFGLAFSVYYIYILATAIVKTNLMWISLFFSIGVFVIFALLFFVMPKINYERMLQNGERVIIGNKSVYYGGTYYHWRNVLTDATFGNFNTKRHKLEIIFTQESKNGDTKRRKVEMYAPDTAIKGISNLLKEYEVSIKKYQEKQTRNSVVNAAEQGKKKRSGK